MQYLEELLDAPDGHAIPVKAWRPREPQALLVIAHGMAEHAGRYAPLAEWLTEQGVAVVALEHRGHSDQCPDDDLGHYADADGWNKVLNDLTQAVDFARELEPGCPVTLFGHSMGSFIAQAWVQRNGEAIDNLMLCATNRINRLELTLSRGIVDLIKAVRGPRHVSQIIDAMTFGKFNKAFEPNRTSHDWLSRDPAQVDEYLADPYCGFGCTTGLWSDFIGGMLTIDPATWRKDLPVHILSGTADPVGEMGAGIGQHITALKAAGVNLTSVQLYDKARHELVNETNAREVWQHINQCLVRRP
ncbi:MAG: alpha/beta hydrolase [Saccharospirillum sp.]